MNNQNYSATGVSTFAASTACMSILAWTSALAQPTAEALAACAAIESEAERLACYDDLVGERGDPEQAPATSQTQRNAQAPPTPRSASPVRGQPAQSAAAAESGDPIAVAETSDPVAAGRGALAGESGAETEEVVEVQAVEEFPQTRAERRAQRRQARQDGQSPQRISVLVVRRVENLSGLSVFVTESGEILDQINTTSSRYPEPPFAAELEPASRGSFWLSTLEGGRPVRVVYRD